MKHLTRSSDKHRPQSTSRLGSRHAKVTGPEDNLHICILQAFSEQTSLTIAILQPLKRPIRQRFAEGNHKLYSCSQQRQNYLSSLYRFESHTSPFLPLLLSRRRRSIANDAIIILPIFISFVSCLSFASFLYPGCRITTPHLPSSALFKVVVQGPMSGRPFNASA